MRLKLIKGKQRELIENYKESNNLTWKQLSEKVSLNVCVLRDLKYELNLIPEMLFLILDENRNYSKFIIEKKPDNWGQSKGGLISNGNTKEIASPKLDSRLAELVGTILGDGALCSYSGKKRGTHQLVIAGHSELDKEYLLNYIKPLIEDSFKIEVNHRYDKKRKVMWIYCTAKRIINFFEKIGIKHGNKIKNNQGIPDWIKNNKNFVKSCLRGLIDTDGSIFRMSNKDPYLLRINFTSHCKKLFSDFYISLSNLGYSPHKYKTKIYLSKQEEVKKYISEIGFSNKKHINRLETFRKDSPLV